MVGQQHTGQFATLSWQHTLRARTTLVTQKEGYEFVQRMVPVESSVQTYDVSNQWEPLP